MKFIDYLPEFIRKYYLGWREDRAWEKAYELGRKEKYAESGTAYADYAREFLEYKDVEYGKLRYVSYCCYAFDMFIKAEDAVKALEQGRNTLSILCSNDGKWLKYNSGTQANDLLKMVVALYGEGYIAEGDALAAEVNEQLVKYDVPLRCVAVPAVRHKFPSSCGKCGGKLPYRPNDKAIECPFCETVIYAQKH